MWKAWDFFIHFPLNDPEKPPILLLPVGPRPGMMVNTDRHWWLPRTGSVYSHTISTAVPDHTERLRGVFLWPLTDMWLSPLSWTSRMCCEIFLDFPEWDQTTTKQSAALCFRFAFPRGYYKGQSEYVRIWHVKSVCGRSLCAHKLKQHLFSTMKTSLNTVTWFTCAGMAVTRSPFSSKHWDTELQWGNIKIALTFYWRCPHVIIHIAIIHFTSTSLRGRVWVRTCKLNFCFQSFQWHFNLH